MKAVTPRDPLTVHGSAEDGYWLEQARALGEAVQWQEERFEAVMAIGRALGGTLHLDDFLRIIIEKTTEVMGAERATLFLIDAEQDEAWSKVLLGDGDTEEIRVPLDSGIVGWVIRTRLAANVSDAYEDERFNPDIDQITGFRSRSVLCMPVFDKRQQVVGAVQVLNKKEGTFTEDDELLLGAVVAQAAISIENSHLYRDLLERNRELSEAEARIRQKMAELDLLYDIERRISAATRLQDILDVILEKACEVSHAEAGSIVLSEEGSGELFFRAVRGDCSDALIRLKLPLGMGIAGLVARDGRPRLIADAKADPHHDRSIDEKLGFVTRSIVAAPLVVRGKSMGAIEILNCISPGGFGEEHLKLVTLIAGQASRAIGISLAREEGERAGRLELIGQMVGGVLHDLKTPMTVIGGHAQLMAMEGDPAAREEHVDAIFKQFDHINAMTQEIMAFARGQRQLLVSKVYLHKFIEEVRELLRLDMDNYSVCFSVDARYQGVARFDANKITRVITNIARNACQAMQPRGGGCFNWVIECDEAENSLIFSFSDTGPGIASEIEDSLFDSFSTHGKEEGTGLGLAIVKKIVEEHGGTIRHSSKSGEGASFRITLPL